MTDLRKIKCFNRGLQVSLNRGKLFPDWDTIDDLYSVVYVCTLRDKEGTEAIFSSASRYDDKESLEAFKELVIQAANAFDTDARNNTDDTDVPISDEGC